MPTNRYGRLQFETLERREMMAANISGGTLKIKGSKGDDNIQVQVATAGPHLGELQVDLKNKQRFFNADTINSIDIRGANGKDSINISSNVNIQTYILGGKGNDTIQGGADTDYIHGDSGNDIIDGGDGFDVVRGNSGDDIVDGGNSFDICYGGEGNDTVRGGDGEDEVWGDFGNDLLWGGDDNDFLDGGEGNDVCHGDGGNDDVKGGIGLDQLNGDAGENLLDSDGDADTLLNGLACDLDHQVPAILFVPDNGNAYGSSDSRFVNDSGVLKKVFTISIHGMPPSTTLAVLIDGANAGQITTDGSGDATLTYSSVPVFADGELLLPSGFPPVLDGSFITIGPNMQGYFVAHYGYP